MHLSNLLSYVLTYKFVQISFDCIELAIECRVGLVV